MYGQVIGQLNSNFFLAEFGTLQTEDVILMGERLSHIREKHPSDLIFLERYGKAIIEQPDILLKDRKHEGTVLLLKKLPDTNLSAVVRLALETDDAGRKNSIMTFYRIREKNFKKLVEKNLLLYKIGGSYYNNY